MTMCCKESATITHFNGAQLSYSLVIFAQCHRTVIYDKKKGIYIWGVEAFYQFKSIDGKKQYLKRLLDVFTKFMKENGYNTEKDCFYELFAYNYQEFKSLEDCYMNFKYYVNGYINS